MCAQRLWAKVNPMYVYSGRRLRSKFLLSLIVGGGPKLWFMFCPFISVFFAELSNHNGKIHCGWSLLGKPAPVLGEDERKTTEQLLFLQSYE